LAGSDAANYQLTVSPGFLTVTRVTPVVSLAADGATFGTALDATATVSGGDDPAGSLRFDLFAGATCQGTALFSSTVELDGAGVYDSAGTGSTLVHAGLNSWSATYLGDDDNAPALAACVAVTVSKAGITLTRDVPSTALVGDELIASITFTGSPPPTGQVLFDLYTGGQTCAESRLIASHLIHLDERLTYSSPAYTSTEPGLYHWVIIYGGDSDYTEDRSICAITTTVGEAPAVSSASGTTFATGASGSFSVTTTAGYPAATTLSVTGPLPTGVAFTDNGDGTGTLAGTPAAETGGTYFVTITAANELGSGTQSFELTVQQPTAITSATAVDFAAGSWSSFTITTGSGYPTATTLEYSGDLPAGVSFVDNGDGTASLAGTPEFGTKGSYLLAITSSNGVPADAVQAFTLRVTEPPTFTSDDAATFEVGSAESVTITTEAGVPDQAALTIAGTLPAGVTFTDHGDGTGSISGTPAAGAGGVHVVTLSASNGTGTADSQTFELTVHESPTITSTDSATVTVGLAWSLDLTTSGGFPVAVVFDVGSLPAGLQFDGTATIHGVTSATAGTYQVTVRASNGATDDAVQTLTLTVVEAAVVPLPSTPPASDGRIDGVPRYTQPLQVLEVTASGYAPGALITWGIYSSPTVLGTSVADSTGAAKIRMTIPAGFAGTHTVVASGIGTDGSARYLTAETVVSALPATGSAPGPAIAAGLGALSVGLLLVIRRRRRGLNH
jgi:LPXTG-motif cell wall-anchored protein